ncbi:MAG: stage II sporulation protein R [Bacillota bacterium]
MLILLITFANKFIFVQPGNNIKRDNLLRLHVIANSNSPEDQLLKREVRNRIIAAGNEIFKDLADAKEAKSIVISNMDYLKRVVQQQIKQKGYNYRTQLRVAEFDFPKRSYGNSTLKAGKYEALQVVIGAGQGSNWWCVLFPPLCFVDSVDKMSPQMINRDQSDAQVEIKFKFKFAEYLKENPELVNSKLNLAKLFDFDSKR